MSDASTTLVSMSEINRVAPWSLRALGYPFGSAERATRHVVWTEAATGGGLAILSSGADAVRLANAGPAMIRSRHPDGTYVVTAFGRHLLDLGPAAIDLATAAARLQGIGAVIVQDVLGTRLAPSLCDLATQRGLATFIDIVPDPTDDAPYGDGRRVWLASLPGSDGPTFVAGNEQDEPAAEFISAWFGPASSERNRAATLLESARTSPGHVAILMSTRAPALPPRRGMRPDWTTRVANAYLRGVEVRRGDLDHLYALEKLTWAPTSERSRKQAGF